MPLRSTTFSLLAAMIVASIASLGSPSEPMVKSPARGPVAAPSWSGGGSGGSPIRAYAAVNEREQARRAPKGRSAAKVRTDSEAERPPAGHGLSYEPTSAPEQPSRATSPASGAPLAPSPEIVGAGFQGIDNNTSHDAIPPDTHGAVGPNHVMVVSNTELTIKDRSGVEVPGSRQTLDNFFQPLAVASMFAFDPKLLYDPYTNRWYLTAVAFPDSANSAVMLAVSANSDPTGSWTLFGIDADPSNATWADYPSFGFNKDWIVVQVNMFTVGGGNAVESKIYVFRKNKVLSGVASSHYRLFTDPDGFAQAPATAYSTTLNTMYLVEDWGGNLQSGPTKYGVLRIKTITGAVGSEVYSSGSMYPATTATWNDGIGVDEFAEQAGTSREIATGDARMQNCVYRNGSLWCAHSVYLPASGTPTRSAVQWWQLSTSGSIVQRGRIEDADGISPQKHYAYPSIAVNVDNDVLLGYGRFGSDEYASAAYRYRQGTDTLSTLRDEVTLKDGLDTYNKDLGYGTNRWGDYSHTVVDPRNDADMWTLQEYADAHTTDGTDRSRWALWWGRVATASFSAPTLTGGIAARFASDVEGVSYGDNFKVTLSGSSTVLSGTLVCRNAAGAALGSCASGVRSATWYPPSPLVPGQFYVASINPDGALSPISIGATNLAGTSSVIRASTQEQESSAAVSPRWMTAGASAAYGGSYIAERLAGSRAHFKFVAPARTTLSWYSVLGPNGGQSTVYIDNVPVKTYNNYNSKFVYKYRRSFTVNPGAHTFSIVVKGLKGSSAGTDTLVTVDAFALGNALHATPGTCASPQATNNCVLQAWRVQGGSGASGGAYALANLAGASTYFTFQGTGVDAYMVKGPTFGKAAIYIDGVYKGTFDGYRSTVQYGVRLSYRGLSNGQHSIRIIVSGTRNASAKGSYAGVDRFVVV